MFMNSNSKMKVVLDLALGRIITILAVAMTLIVLFLDGSVQMSIVATVLCVAALYKFHKDFKDAISVAENKVSNETYRNLLIDYERQLDERARAIEDAERYIPEEYRLESESIRPKHFS